MTSWHEEIVAGVQRQFKADAEASERERKRREAVADFSRRTLDAVKSFCSDANGQLGKQIFTVVPVSQDNNYLCSITYAGPTERLGGISLDRDLRGMTITTPGQIENLRLEPDEDGTAVAVHPNGSQFTPDELVEELIRSITQIEAGRKFQKRKRAIRLENEIHPREW